MANKAFLEGVIEESVTNGLIKAIPNQVSYSLLKHWRPISMMPVICKRIAKVVADMLTLMLNKMLNPCQNRFIKGSSINDNILVAMGSIEYAKLTKKEYILL